MTLAIQLLLYQSQRSSSLHLENIFAVKFGQVGDNCRDRIWTFSGTIHCTRADFQHAAKAVSL